MALLPQTQKIIPVGPLGSLVAGYNNNQIPTLSSVVGSNNRVLTSLTNITGHSNSTAGSTGSISILGSFNQVKGEATNIIGSNNIVSGQTTLVSGNQNSIKAVLSAVFGDLNIMESNLATPKYNFISGNNNIIKSENCYFFGNQNEIDDGLKDSWVLGHNNNTFGGLIVTDYSGLTESGPTSYSPPVMSQTDKLWVIGSENQIGTQSSGVRIFGDSNLLSASVSNSVIFGNGETIDTTNNSQFYIGSSYDLNIKGTVLPCNLVQDFTPPSSGDTTYPEGAITKDDNNIWVRTTGLGWRQIPFNNSYGSFYDTTTQTNPTASQINYMKYNSGSGNNVSIVNNSEVTVDFDGLYNIQFSAQINKPSGGTHDVDIWLVYNGTIVDWSNTRITLQGNNAKTVAAWNWIQSMTASSNFQIAWSSSDTNVEIYALGTQSTPTRPAIPSIILTVDKISSI